MKGGRQGWIGEQWQESIEFAFPLINFLLEELCSKITECCKFNTFCGGSRDNKYGHSRNIWFPILDKIFQQKTHVENECNVYQESIEFI